MSTKNITVDQAREQLRIDGSDDDAWLQLAIDGATEAAEHWCGGYDRIRGDDRMLLPQAALAILVEVAYQYAYREGPDQSALIDWASRGYPLSPGATSLLASLHAPVYA